MCDKFETAYKSGTEPNIEEYLDGITQSVWPVLLKELLALDRAYQAKLHESLSLRHDRQHSPFAPHSSEQPHPTESTDEQIPREALPGGDYVPLARLGRGGMGEVYLARQISTGRLAVLKIIRPDRLAELPDEKRDEWIQRFKVEGEITGQLDHGNIVSVYTIGEVAGQPFLAMQYVAGQNLADLLKEGPLPASQTAQLLEKVARAVHYAHEQGILHRDLKPRNILLDSVGRPYVTDFGLAKWVLEDAPQLTVTGDMLGSPPYMSPEQIQNSAQVTAASDVYSLGATLYHMVTGRPPFLALTIPEMIHLVLEDDPVPPSRLQPNLPRDLETICLKCLHKEPSKRYCSVLELAEDLHRFTNNEPIHARPMTLRERASRWASRNPAWATALSIGLIALLTVLSVMLGYNVYLHRAYQEVETKNNLAHARLQTTRMIFDQALTAYDELARQVSEANLQEVPQLESVRRAWLSN